MVNYTSNSDQNFLSRIVKKKRKEKEKKAIPGQIITWHPQTYNQV